MPKFDKEKVRQGIEKAKLAEVDNIPEGHIVREYDEKAIEESAEKVVELLKGVKV